MKALAYAAIITMISASAMAGTTTTNDVYIETLGSSSTISIEQVGSGNRVGQDRSRTAIVNGNNAAVTVQQRGNSNSTDYSIIGTGVTYQSSVLGNSNSITLQCGGTGPTQSGSCNGSTISESVSGNANTLQTIAIGAGITSSTTVNGNANQISTTIESPNARNTTIVNGDNNTLTSTIAGSGGQNGHSLAVNITGDGNNILTAQQGSFDTNVYVRVTGSLNNVAVRTTNN